jgi:hypothetical protein
MQKGAGCETMRQGTIEWWTPGKGAVEPVMSKSEGGESVTSKLGVTTQRLTWCAERCEKGL